MRRSESGGKGKAGHCQLPHLIGARVVVLAHLGPTQQGPAPGPQGRWDALPALHLYLRVRSSCYVRSASLTAFHWPRAHLDIRGSGD